MRLLTKGSNMMMNAQIDHDRYPKLLRLRSLQELRYAIADCLAAIAAYPEGGKAGSVCSTFPLRRMRRPAARLGCVLQVAIGPLLG